MRTALQESLWPATLALYREGLPLYVVAERVGVSGHTVAKWLRDEGLQVPPKGWRMDRPRPDDATVSAAYAEGGSVARAARILGVGHHLTWTWLRAAGVQLRKQYGGRRKQA